MDSHEIPGLGLVFGDDLEFVLDLLGFVLGLSNPTPDRIDVPAVLHVRRVRAGT